MHQSPVIHLLLDCSADPNNYSQFDGQSIYRKKVSRVCRFDISANVSVVSSRRCYEKKVTIFRDLFCFYPFVKMIFTFYLGQQQKSAETFRVNFQALLEEVIHQEFIFHFRLLLKRSVNNRKTFHFLSLLIKSLLIYDFCFISMSKQINILLLLCANSQF